MNLIKFENVFFSYGGVNILEDINFNINLGDFIYMVGENGSGKTTLLRGLLGLKKPDKGKITFSDEISKNEIGYIPQQKDIKRDFPASVFEIVLSGRLSNKKGIFYKSIDKKIAMKNLEKLDIVNLKNKPYKYLSGGQQQRVLIARALCATGKILILDEPDTGLDPEAKKELYKLLKYLNKEENISIVMVTHDLKENIKDGIIFRVGENALKVLKDGDKKND